MQPHTVGCCVVPINISRPLTVACRKALRIGKRHPIIIDGAPIEIPAVNFITDVLHYRQLGLHKAVITAIILMTHQAPRQLDMTKLRFTTLPHVAGYPRYLLPICSRKGFTSQSLRHMLTAKSRKCPAVPACKSHRIIHHKRICIL